MIVKSTLTENGRAFTISGNVVLNIRDRLSDEIVNALLSYF